VGSALNTSRESEIAEIRISPDSASMGVTEQMDFEFFALTEAGNTVRDANLEVSWWSTDPTVFTVETGGMAVGREPGTAFCMVEVIEHPKIAPFTGRDSAFVSVFQF
jgi:hypothetical protein